MKKAVDFQEKRQKQSNFSSLVDRLLNKAGVLPGGVFLKDILSKRYHSSDFKETRADYIASRLKIMAIIFAVLVPMSAILDYFLLSPDQFQAIFIARIGLAVILIAVFFVVHFKSSCKTIEVLLPLSFLFPSLFYAVCMVILKGENEPAVSIGFSYTPFLCVAMMGLYPMTIVTCTIVASAVFIPTFGVEFYLGSFLTIETLNKLWAFFMFLAVSWWVQTGQLLMLLKLYRESSQDLLTGLMNRRVLIKFLNQEKNLVNEEHQQGQDNAQCFCLLMFDLDRFKRINDNYGHLSGDLVLKSAAQLLQSQFREQDVIARFGGEEFIAVVPGLNIDESYEIAERIRLKCSELEITLESGEILHVTTSIGVTQYRFGESIEVALERADQYLYIAKQQGRNQVVSDSHGNKNGGAASTISACG